MLDMRRLREDPEGMALRLHTKDAGADVDGAMTLDRRRRDVLAEVERLKNERNVASKELGRRKQAGEETEAPQAALRALSERIKGLDGEVREVEAALESAMLALPNLPHASTPVGKSEADNRVIRVRGEPRSFAFAPAPHWELGERLGILDFARAARMSGAGFPILLGDGARLQRALIQFMLDVHVREHGYREIAPPLLVHAAAMTGTGQLPKLADDMYRLEADGLYLIPTAEVPITNLYREEIIEKPLPIYLTAFTPCFRREAGAAGRDTRGLIRIHQFDKVEMVKFVEPDGSYDELESLLGNATDILDRLDLHYRVIELCTADLSFAAAKCYDIELWSPAQERWLEVSSCSNFEDFQARRAQIRYRNAAGKPEYPHTLNGSGVALPRLMVAILENGQQEDGSILLPEVIRPYLGGQSVIGPAAG
jgi:seryl-tRNA synthetase